MKKYGIPAVVVVMILASAFLGGIFGSAVTDYRRPSVSGQPPESRPPAVVQPQVVELKIKADGAEKISVKEDKKDENIVRRSMAVDNPEATLSGITSIIDNVGYMQIYGSLSATETRSFWMDTQILKQKYGITKIKIFLNSGGGSAYAGLAMADLIMAVQKDGFEIEVFCSGLVASAAVPIYAACGKRVASDGCVFMVHKAKLFKYVAQEDINDLEAQKEMMRIIRAKYLDIMATRSKLDRDEWEKLLEKTTWFTADQALEWGLVDEIR